MSRNVSCLVLFGLIFSLSSCIVQEKYQTVQIEVLKPGRYPLPVSGSTIGVVNNISDPNDSIWIFEKYVRNKPELSRVGRNSITSKYSVNLAKYLINGKQFKDVRYFDKPNTIAQNKINPGSLFSFTNTDICLSVDSVNIYDKEMGSSNYKYRQAMGYISWSLVWKKDSSLTVIRRDTTLKFPEAVITTAFGKTAYDAPYLAKMCSNLAYCIGEEISPKWLTVDRLYHHSKNLAMLKAEEFAQENDWITAAELWETKTAIKKRKLAAKACFNMALACEMEGKPGLALDWVKKSKALTRKYDDENQAICSKYQNVLESRIKEMSLLEIQMSN